MIGPIMFEQRGGQKRVTKSGEKNISYDIIVCLHASGWQEYESAVYPSSIKTERTTDTAQTHNTSVFVLKH